MLNLYCCLVYPHLQYCNLIWGCAPNSYTNKILLLPKKIVRIITKSNYLAHTDELFPRTNFLKVNDLNKYLLGIYAYKLARRDQLQTSMHSYKTRLSSTYVRPAYQRLSVTQNSLSFRARAHWPLCLATGGRVFVAGIFIPVGNHYFQALASTLQFVAQVCDRLWLVPPQTERLHT